eukprot:scaffold311472_cov96-Cyclotella_meneghiniana.AAC.1
MKHLTFQTKPGLFISLYVSLRRRVNDCSFVMTNPLSQHYPACLSNQPITIINVASSLLSHAIRDSSRQNPPRPSTNLGHRPSRLPVDLIAMTAQTIRPVIDIDVCLPKLAHQLQFQLRVTRGISSVHHIHSNPA